jgi:hypothetical protein
MMPKRPLNLPSNFIRFSAEKAVDTGWNPSKNVVCEALAGGNQFSPADD